MTDRLELQDAVKRQPIAITVAKTSEIEVIGHQRKARPAHLKALTASMERLGFLSALIAVERDGKFVIIDGQHRFQAGTELGMKEFPVIVVPEETARRMMSLNVEQGLNIRERATIALAIYRELLEESPELAEDDGELVDTIETAHLVTLGLAYEGNGRLAGSAYEPLLKKCDGFVDEPLAAAYVRREARAEKVLEAAKLVKAVEDALKESGAWHSMVRYQIIGAADPMKRARKPADFDKTFDKFLAALAALADEPRKVLSQKVD
jgi:ParB family transcriptional regulator, chromosome partitioning protein